MTIQNKIFEQLLIIIPDLLTREEAGKSTLPSLMDLNLDILNRDENKLRIALSHYYKHETGDMIADPDMEIFVDTDKRIATARTYQDSFMFNDVVQNEKVDESLEHQLNEFLTMWLENNINYGHKIGE